MSARPSPRFCVIAIHRRNWRQALTNRIRVISGRVEQATEALEDAEGDEETAQCQATLDRHGPIAYDETTAESVLVELVISVAEAADQSVEIPLVSLAATR